MRVTSDLELLLETTGRFLSDHGDVAIHRAAADQDIGLDLEWWRQAASLGWTSLLVSEKDGGGSVSEAPVRDAACIAEMVGSVVAPGPLLPVNVVASAVSGAGSAGQREEVLPGLLSGEVVAAWCPGRAWEDRYTVVARPVPDGFVLSGADGPIEGLAQASVLLVTADTPAGVTQFLVDPTDPGVTREPLQSVDLTRRYGQVGFHDVPVPSHRVLGEVGQGAGAVQRQLDVALVLQGAGALGSMDSVLAMTIDYLSQRVAFGRPLASYQALKHRIADLKMGLEASRACVAGASTAVSRDAAHASELASAAKAYGCDHGVELVQDCVQLHGGIGLTWELDLHLFLRRLTVERLTYGTPADHRARVASIDRERSRSAA